MKTYCASTLPFSPYQLTEFVGGLSENGVSAIELAQAHFSDVEAETIATLQEETGLHFKSMLSTVRVDAPDGLEALIEILDTAQRLSIPIVSIASGGNEDATAREIETIIDHLKTVTEEAQARNLTLALYAHEGSLAYNLERTQQILNAIPSENFGFTTVRFIFIAAETIQLSPCEPCQNDCPVSISTVVWIQGQAASRSGHQRWIFPLFVRR